METSWRNSSSNFSDGLVANASGSPGQDPAEEIDLAEILGPKRSPFFLPVTGAYLLIFVVGLSGNLLTCAVIAKHQKMRTPTNLYLVSLAASDLLVLLLGMPLEVYDLWQNYPFPFWRGVCYFKTFLFETVCFASILNVTALSVERYIAVVHPLKTRYLSTNRHAKRVIGLVWLASMICAVPNTSLHGIYYLPHRKDESAICTVLRPRWIYNLLMQVTAVCFFLVPMLVISVLYLVMGLHLSRRRRSAEGQTSGRSAARRTPHVEDRRRRQVTKMLSIVVAVFGVCWAPFHMERLLWSSVSQWTNVMHSVYECVHIVSGVFFYLSSAANPIIYSLLSTRFRESFRELVCSRPADGSSAPGSPKPSKVLLSPTVSAEVRGRDGGANVPLLSLNASGDASVLAGRSQPDRRTTAF